MTENKSAIRNTADTTVALHAPNPEVKVLAIRICGFEFVSDFEFRISSFGLRVYIVLTMPLLVGCALTRDASSPLGEGDVPRDHLLVVHSDFDLPQDHPLREELANLLKEVSHRLELPPLDQLIHVQLFDSSGDFRSFMNHRFPGLGYRRAFFVEHDDQLWVYASWGERIAEDLRHEVTHAHLHAVVPHIPLWLDEGLAEYFEVSHGQHRVNRPHVDYLLDRLQLGRWSPNIPRLESLVATDEMTQQDYAEAWCWVHWLLDSTPAQSSLLKGHLAQCGRDHPARPLSQTLVSLPTAPEEMVIQHLKSLRKPH